MKFKLINNRKLFFICSQWTLITMLIFFGLFYHLMQRPKIYKRTVHRDRSDMDDEDIQNDIRQSDVVILSTETKTIHRQFVQMKYGSIYLFGVAAGNTSQNAIWDTVKIYGGLDKQRAGRVHFSCCLAYKDGNKLVYEQERPVRIRAFQVASPIWSIHLTCINLRHVNRTVPVGAAITIKPYTCNDSDVTYVQPYFPLRETGTKIAIGTKTAYGNVSAESIIEWMEAYKHLGVDKVVSYYISTINTDALKVLQYYASTGILDLFYYEPAASDLYPRNFYTDRKQRWNDQQIVVDDSFERMSGYKYFGIVDHDEIILPYRRWTIKQMLDNLFNNNENATGMSFKSQYFYLSWGPSSNKSDMIIRSYIQRPNEPPKLGNTKNLYMPSRVGFGGVDTHVIKPVERRYKMYAASPGFGTLFHYRSCRQKNYTECMTQFERVTDTRVADWAERLQEKVERVREIVFGSKHVTP